MFTHERVQKLLISAVTHPKAINLILLQVSRNLVGYTTPEYALLDRIICRVIGYSDIPYGPRLENGMYLSQV